jgi:8-oxo-dGTP diphosphatase
VSETQLEKLILQAKMDNIVRIGVSAVIARGSRVLLVRRKSDDFLGGIYEFPGGEVEKNESVHDALLREVKEETGLRVSAVKNYLGSFDYDSEKGRTRVFNYLVEVAGIVELKLSEHDAYAWTTKENEANISLTKPILTFFNEYWSRCSEY